MKRTIAGKDYQFKEADIPIKELHFWPENPRIHAELYSPYNTTPDFTDPQLQQKIYDKLKGTEHSNVRDLREQIERSGLTDPLIVRRNFKHHAYDVLEGNRRLAACKMILERYEGKSRADLIKRFSSLSCEVAPDNFPDSHVFALLGTLHISGKIDWEPFAIASYVKRRIEVLEKEGFSKDVAMDRAAAEIGYKKQEIETRIATVNLMKYAKEKETTKYSFYDILVRNRVVHKDLEDKILKKRWVDSIREWQQRALDYRSAVQATVKDPKSLKKFQDGKLSLKRAAQQAEDSGSTDIMYQKVKRFRISMVNAKPRLKEIKTTDTAFQKLKYEFDKLERLINDITRILDK